MEPPIKERNVMKMALFRFEVLILMKRESEKKKRTKWNVI